MFDNLSSKFDKAFQILKGHGKITEINVAETLKEIRRALLDADVNFKIAKEFTVTIKEKALGQKVLTSLKPGQLLVKIVKDELTRLMGAESASIKLNNNPSIILMSGLQGSGKTTFSGKLALHLKKKFKKKPLLVACDVYRPAAIDQLGIVADQIGVSVYELGLAFVGGYANEEVEMNSGEVLYIDNRNPITRSADQNEEIKVVIEF